MAHPHWLRTSGTRKTITRRLHCGELLEPRLALTWAGVPPALITPPSSAASVTLSSQAQATGSASVTSNEVDYYTFTATTSGSYLISTGTPTSNLDSVLGVFSSSGQRIAYNDDIVTGSQTDSRLTVVLTAGTKYYFGVTNYDTSSAGAYTWNIAGPASAPLTDDSFENNDTFTAAANLGTITSTRTVSPLVMADSRDWFRFTLTSAGTSGSSVSISFQNSQGDLQLALYNASASLLRQSAGTGNGETISLSGLAAGTYYVRVAGRGGAVNPSYSLTITPPNSSVTPPNPNPAPAGNFQITLDMTGLTASQQSVFQQAADRWEQVIVGDLPNATYQGQLVDDLLIDASAISIDGVNGILGQAGPDAFRSSSRLPYHGIMQFDTADVASMENSGLLFSVVLHEMGHVLGIGTLWSSLGLLTGVGSNPIFRGAQATAAYNQLFGANAAGVPVEDTGGPGTINSHWRESVFSTELMTGWAGPGNRLPMSIVTVASLADIGYSVNIAAADPFTPTSGARAAAIASASSTSTSSRLMTTVDASIGVQEPPPGRSALANLRPSESSSVPSLRPQIVDSLFSQVQAGSDDAGERSGFFPTHRPPDNAVDLLAGFLAEHLAVGGCLTA